MWNPLGLVPCTAWPRLHSSDFREGIEKDQSSPPTVTERADWWARIWPRKDEVNNTTQDVADFETSKQ